MHTYETLFRDLEEHGWAVADRFMPGDLAKRLYQSAQQSWLQGLFHDAHVGSQQAELRDTSIRGDTILWLDDDNPLPACQDFFAWASDLQERLNRHFYLGLKRGEFHFARYDTGYGYKMHIDQHQGQPHRQITLILYLNPQWGDQDGGELCMVCLADHTKEIQRIRPRHDRLVLFRSGLIPHAVLPCARPRWSLTGWFRTDNHDAIHPGRAF